MQDDIPVVIEKTDNHSIGDPLMASTRPLAEAIQPHLYRLLMTVGSRPSGSPVVVRPMVFRVTSIALDAASAAAFFRLATLLLPVEAAWVAPAFFAADRYTSRQWPSRSTRAN